MFEVISLYCVGRTKVFKKGEIVSASDFDDINEKIKGGFVKPTEKEKPAPVITAPEVQEESRLAEGLEDTVIAPTAPSISDAKNTETPTELKITPAPKATKVKGEIVDL